MHGFMHSLFRLIQKSTAIYVQLLNSIALHPELVYSLCIACKYIVCCLCVYRLTSSTRWNGKLLTIHLQISIEKTIQQASPLVQ